MVAGVVINGHSLSFDLHLHVGLGHFMAFYLYLVAVKMVNVLSKAKQRFFQGDLHSGRQIVTFPDESLMIQNLNVELNVS